MAAAQVASSGPGLNAVVEDFAGATIDTARWVVAGAADRVVQNDRLVIGWAPKTDESAGLRYKL